MYVALGLEADDYCSTETVMHRGFVDPLCYLQSLCGRGRPGIVITTDGEGAVGQTTSPVKRLILIKGSQSYLRQMDHTFLYSCFNP